MYPLHDTSTFQFLLILYRCIDESGELFLGIDDKETAYIHELDMWRETGCNALMRTYQPQQPLQTTPQ